METYRGEFREALGLDGCDPLEQDMGPDVLPPAIGADERRMQMRAYQHWALLAQGRGFPVISDLALDALPDFGPYSVLLDFTAGGNEPAIRYLGQALAAECGCTGEAMARLADVPQRSLLSRITDHYRQIHVNQAPIGFEAEFTNPAGHPILYRGVLLPFSSCAQGGDIDQIFGVISWKELADQHIMAGLISELDQALDRRLPLEMLPEHLTAQLRGLAAGPLDGLSPRGEEFALVLVRRKADGPPLLVGEVRGDAAWLGRAAQQLIV